VPLESLLPATVANGSQLVCVRRTRLIANTHEGVIRAPACEVPVAAGEALAQRLVELGDIGQGAPVVKKLFLATTAFVVLTAASAGAADMTARPVYGAPPPAPVYTWTGMYLGANVGYTWGQSKNDGALPGFGFTTNETQNMNGVIGGGQTGYNYQFGSWVWGFESDLQASGQKGSSIIPVVLGTAINTDHKLEWFGTSRSRLGFLATPNLLLYGTGGVAYGQTKDPTPPQPSVFPWPAPSQP
jgi:opacity protein-like surface antigen